ncbi:ATP-binding cassette domain-containing protein [Kribbella solani]|uniref:ABC-2 type transport system ATP-binding protein n=1 Tax=Kribbella solani TaxID=236067 RepID=A0A841DLT4_9ACTN|nr:ATP-binding cassette domain-containing protein [Kribbella solani]MBB5977620.1 ABC-2 type transport system ATP-binding protein [Kribbella solani]
MSDATIEVAGLRKRYGSATALDNMTFTAQAGRVTGLIGPNGAGKSTTMRIILGLHRADSGRALVGGQPYQSYPCPPRSLGALLDASAVHPARSGRNHLLWLAQSQGLGHRRVDQVLEQVGLAGAGRRGVGGYSLGMRQRLGIAAALLGDPPTLMLDEPFNGMDPEGIVWLRGYLRGLAAEGRAVLVSSHLMSELQDMADHVVVVGRGRVIADSSVAALIAGVSDGQVRVRTTAPESAAAVLSTLGGQVTYAEPQVLLVRGPGAEQVAEALSAAGLGFSELAPHRATLEEAYFALTGDAADYRATGGVAS